MTTTPTTADLVTLHEELKEHVAEAAQRLEVPGVAVGVYAYGAEDYAFYGVTSVDNPLPIDADTLFPVNSTGKTFTGTAMICLVDRGVVDLDAPVRTYVPELRLADQDVARRVTVLNLLNHTAGWDGDLFADTGDGDDALERYVASMATLAQVSPLGTAVTYNNASLALAGRVIEKVTGDTFEQAIATLLFQPLGLKGASYSPVDIMTRRFTVGHTRRPDGSLAVARPWEAQRSLRPMGVGLSMPVADLIAWARFHLGDGRAGDGTQVLSAELLRHMQRPTAEWQDSPFGEASIGVNWLLRDVGGVQLVFHDGDGGGHHSAFLMAPGRGFALTILTNGTDGRQLRDEVQAWALEAYLGLTLPDPASQAVLLSDAELAAYTGIYELHDTVFEITADAGQLVIEVHPAAEIATPSTEAVTESFPRLHLGLLPGGEDRYVVTSHPHRGLLGRFVRGESGAVERVHFGGLLATRRGAIAEAHP